MVKKLLQLLLLFMIMTTPWAATGQTIQIGHGTSTTYSVPINIRYDYGYAQMIYSKEDIAAGNPLSNTVTSIAFEHYKAQNKTFDITVYMKNVDYETFPSTDYEPVTTADVVYEGTITPIDGFTEIVLTTPFSYDPDKHLLIAVNKTGGGKTSPNYSWRHITKNNSVLYNSTEYDTERTEPYDPLTETLVGHQNQKLPNIQITFYETPIPSVPEATLTDGDGTIATLSWTENGIATNWILQYGTDEDFSGGSYTEITSGFDTTDAPVISYDATNLTPETKYFARVKAYYDEYNSSRWSNVGTFIPTDALSLSLYEPAGNTGQNSYVPFFRNIHTNSNTASQFIIPATDIYAMQGGSISKLTFYNTENELDYGEAEFKVYVKEVDSTTLTVFTDWTTLTEVYTGTVHIYHGKLDIMFDSPFPYSNRNLLVGFMQDSAGSDNAPKNTKWYGDETKPTGSGIYTYGTTTARTGFLPKVTISYFEGTDCITPIALEGTATNRDATITWLSNASQWQVAYSTDPDANPNDNIVALVNTLTYSMNDLAIGNHYFWVRSFCSTTEQSEWTGPVSVNIDYCYPAPSNVDGDGISHVSFGIGGIVVNNDTPKATYTDYHDLVGAVYQGVEATVAITYSIGFTYGTIIWVDLNGNASFEEEEIVYTGTSTNANPTTLEAMIVVPYTQPLGDYRMRIGGADSAFDHYINGTSTVSPDPCYDGNWACFQDYTLRVLEAPDCMPAYQLAVTTDVRTATFTWESDSNEWDIAYSTSATADPNDPANQIAKELTTKQYQMENLANGDHYFWVRSHCVIEVHSPWAGPVKASIGYCVPNSSSVDGNGIANVTFGTDEMIVNNDTPKETYHDYSNLVGTMKAGVTSTVAITYATGYTYGTIIWVDWNNNLTLEDDEIMYKGQSASSNPTTLNASIHISATQAIGDYRMRIGGADSDFDAYIAGTSTEAPDPCYVGTWACFQDYTIRVTEAPGCLAPDNLTATEDQANSSVLNWTSYSGETSWKVYYKKVSETSYTEVDVTEIPYTLENLTAATNYQYYVVADCSPEGSQPSEVCAFSTNCPTDMPVPYIENFDNYTVVSNTIPSARVLPNCWEYINTSTHQNNMVYPSINRTDGTTYAQSNPNYLMFYCTAYSDADYDPQNQYAIMPAMENLNSLRLKLYARRMSLSYDATFKVGVMEGDNFVQVGDDISPVNESYQQYIIPFDAYNGTGTNIAIMIEATEAPTTSWSVAYRAVLIDNITVEEIPSCTEPTNLEFTLAGKHYLAFSWTAGGTESNWKFQYKKHDDTEWITVDGALTESSYTLQNLDAATTYDARVAAWCDPTNPEGISVYSDPVSATTDCDVITSLPWVVTFEGFDAYTVPMCWDNSTSTAHEINNHPEYIWGVYSFNANKMIRMYNYYVHSGTALINTPEIALPSEPMELTFNYSNRANCGPMTVKISEDGGTTFTDLQSFDVTGSANYSDPGEFSEATISLAAYTGKTVIIQFYSEANYSNGAIYVDDVVIDVPPTCAKPTNLACNSKTAHTATLSWTNGDAGQDAWQIAYSTEADFNPNDVTPIDVTTNPYTITGLTPNTPYYAYVRANCGDPDGYSKWNNNKVAFTTAIGNAKPTDVAVDPASITSSEAVVNWNGVESNDYHESFDVYYSGLNTIPSTLQADSLITGITVTSHEFNALEEEKTYYVWVRDYCGEDGYSAWTAYISFTTAKACQTPDGVIASEVTAHSAKISWNTYGQTTFNLRYRVNGDTWTVVNETTCPYIFDNVLSNNTDYEVQVQAVCDTEVWSDIYGFTTECDAIIITQTDKYFEDFESPVVTSEYGSTTDIHVPGCWDNDSDNTTAKQTYPHMIAEGAQYNYAATGQVLYFYGNGNNYALLPEFANAINELQIKFKWASEGSNQGTLTVGYITADDDNFNTFTTIKSYAASSASQGKLITETVYLNEVPNTASRLVFRWYYSSWYGANVDDVEVALIPSCFPVEALSYDPASITSSSVVLNWTLVDENQDAWEIEYATNADFTENVHNIDVTTHENYTLGGLDNDTHYYVHVRSNCGGTDGDSEWCDAIDFTTIPSCPVPTNLEASNITEVSADLTWTASTEVDAYGIQYRPAATYDIEYTEEFSEVPAASYNADEYYLPDEWYSYNTSSTGFVPRVSNSGKYSYISAFGTDNNFLLMTTNAIGQSAYAIMPQYDDICVVQFDYAFESASYGTLSVGYVIDESDYDSYTVLQTMEPKTTKTHFRLSDADIAIVNNHEGYIAFRYESGTSSFYSVGIDNVLICAGTEYVDPWTTATVTAPNTGTYTLTGLTANNKYDVRVYSNCSTDIEVENCTITMSTLEAGNKVFATEGAWGTASNWIPEGVPALTDNVILRANVTVESGCIAQANKITLDGIPAPTITIEDGGQLLASSLLNATMKKTITGYGDIYATTNKGYHLIATPTMQANPATAGLITDNLGNTATTETSTYDLYSWNGTATAQWKNYRDNVFTLTNAKGYLYASREGVEITFSGAMLNNSVDKQVPLIYNTEAATGEWNLIGNPFVCNATISISDNATVNYYKIGTGDNDGILVPASGAVAPMEGIFVKATAENQEATFTRVVPGVTSNKKDGILEIALNSTNNRGTSMIDNARVRFGEGNELEKFQLDGGSSKVYIPQDGTDYAVVYSKGQGRMPVNVKVAKTGKYTISFSNEDVEFDYLHLIDNFTGADIDLLIDESYTFTASTKDKENRFILVFKAIDNNYDPTSDIFVYQNGDELIVNGEGTLQVFDVMGRFVASYEVYGNKRINASQFSNAVYIFRMVGETVKTQKIVVR